MRVSETGALPNRRAAYKPPNPPPTITTRCSDAIAYGMQRAAELILRYASPSMGPLVVPGIPAGSGTGWFGDLSLMWLPWAAFERSRWRGGRYAGGGGERARVGRS